MRCGSCGGDTHVVKTREGKLEQTIRTRMCRVCGNSDETWEVRRPAVSTQYLEAAHVAVQNRRARRSRDIWFAQNLHRGGETLAAEAGIHRANVYQAALRGRRYLKSTQTTSYVGSQTTERN